MGRLVFLSSLFVSLLFAAYLTTREAHEHIGENATVCGKVYGGYYAASSNGQPTFINLDGEYPHQLFTVVIWGENRGKFGPVERRWKGRRICVTGFIDAYRGIPQIVVDDPEQVRLEPSK